MDIEISNRKMPLISVVVPIHNVEGYLNRCIASIVQQTYTNLEILLIDDGSTDASYQIIESWGKKDRRIRCIRQPYRGVSAARNAGIREAKGEYLCFSDSDDELDQRCCEVLLDLCLVNDVDLSIGTYDYTEDGKQVKIELVSECMTSDETMGLLLDERITTAVWGKMYAMPLIRSCPFIEGMVHEDTLVVLETITKANRCALCNEVLYHYYAREGSITHTYSEQNYKDMIRAQNLAEDFLAKHYSPNDPYVFLRKICNWWVAQTQITKYRKYCSKEFMLYFESVQEERRKQILDFYGFWGKVGNLSLKNRIKVLMIMFCPAACYPVWSFRKQLKRIAGING